MRVALFLICLFYLLPGGYNYAYSGSRHNSYPPEWHIKKNHQSKFTNKKQGYPVVKEASPGQETIFYIMEDVEDEDTNNLSARKYKLLASHYYASSYSISLIHLHSRYRSPRPVHSLFFDKYITQRALRI